MCPIYLLYIIMIIYCYIYYILHMIIYYIKCYIYDVRNIIKLSPKSIES